MRELMAIDPDTDDSAIECYVTNSVPRILALVSAVRERVNTGHHPGCITQWKPDDESPHTIPCNCGHDAEVKALTELDGGKP